MNYDDRRLPQREPMKNGKRISDLVLSIDQKGDLMLDELRRNREASAKLTESLRKQREAS